MLPPLVSPKGDAKKSCHLSVGTKRPVEFIKNRVLHGSQFTPTWHTNQASNFEDAKNEVFAKIKIMERDLEIHDHILIILEEWREKRGLSKTEAGAALQKKDASPKSRHDAWARLMAPRKDTGKPRQLTVEQLINLADFFGVSPVTIIIEAQHRMGKHSGGSEEHARTA